MWNSGGLDTIIALDLAVTVPELSVTEVSQRQRVCFSDLIVTDSTQATEKETVHLPTSTPLLFIAPNPSISTGCLLIKLNV